MGINILQYGFIVRGIEAGLVIAIIAPLVGIFLVLRRYSLIADTLSHVSLAGVAIGLLLKVDPIITAVVASVSSSIVIERLRESKRVFGESALAIFLSGSLAVAIIIISFAHGFSVDLFNYLFGSIVTVGQNDVYIIAGLGLVVIVTLILFYKEILYVTFDEESAKVAGIPTRFINLLVIILASLTVALSIPIVGVLLIAALIVIPALTALQLKRNFVETIVIAEVVSIVSVLAGIFIAYYLNLSTGGVIVLLNIFMFVISLLLTEVYGRRN